MMGFEAKERVSINFTKLGWRRECVFVVGVRLFVYGWGGWGVLDIEQYVEFEMSVLISPPKSLISSRWVIYIYRDLILMFQ